MRLLQLIAINFQTPFLLHIYENTSYLSMHFIACDNLELITAKATFGDES